jgi:tetratricopeptide (TPR) repeat protein
MPRELIELNARNLAIKITAILALIGVAVWSSFVVRWYLGNTIAEYFVMEENSIEAAKRAESLAPRDPLTHWRLADVLLKKLPPDQLAQVTAEYEEAVRLSPNDYRLWMALGLGLEQLGDTRRGEEALRQATELAPSYVYPHWYLGNLLLRTDRYDEGFAELRRASDADPEFRPQLFNLAWQVYNPDFDALKIAVGSTAEARAGLTLYLFGLQRFDDGLRLWNSLNESEKRANISAGLSIVSSLTGAQRFHDAMHIWNELAPDESSRASTERIMDGGFEDDITHGPEAVFGWQVKQANQMQIGIDPSHAHTGVRSLRLLFQVHSRLDSINISQLVPVSANTQYDFEYYVKTEKLQSGSTPVIQVVEAADSSVLASSESAGTGDNDWKRVPLSFKTGTKTQAVIVRTVREGCGETPVCPIFGMMWYDDFRFQRRN